MEKVHTVRIRQDWLTRECNRLGGMSFFAKKVGVTTSTISRHFHGRAEAGPRFIGAVLAAYPEKFERVFDVTEEAATVRRARMVKQIVTRENY